MSRTLETNSTSFSAFMLSIAKPFLPSLTFCQGLKTQQILVPAGSHPSTFNIDHQAAVMTKHHVTILQVPFPLLQAQGALFKPEHDWNGECLSACVRYCSSCSMLSLSHLHLRHLESVACIWSHTLNPPDARRQ